MRYAMQDVTDLELIIYIYLTKYHKKEINANENTHYKELLC